MIKVVVIEDEFVLRNGLVLTTPWESFDCEVVGEADNGFAGMELIRKANPDIVITDIKMPGIDGIEMMRQLGETNANETEFIIITGYNDFAYAKSAVDLGAQGYILKPIDDDELKKILTKTVNKVKERRRIDQVLKDKPQNVIEYIEHSSLADQSVNHNRYLNKAIEYIHEHYHENFSIKDIADHLQISESYLTKLFRNKTSYTVLEYCTNYRLKKAIDLLMDNNVKIYEIADKVGYQDSRYFSTIFKKSMGLTPSDFRNYYLSQQKMD